MNWGDEVVVVSVVMMWLKMDCVVGVGGAGWAKLLYRCNSAAVQKKVLEWPLEHERMPTS